MVMGSMTLLEMRFGIEANWVEAGGLRGEGNAIPLITERCTQSSLLACLWNILYYSDPPARDCAQTLSMCFRF